MAKDEMEKKLTEQKLKESRKKLKESKEWLSITLKSIGDAVIATNTKGDVMFLNPIAEALTGWNQIDTLGRHISDIFKI